MIYSKKNMGEKEKMSKQSENKKYKNGANAGRKSTFEKIMISIIAVGIVILLFINFAFPVIKEKTKKVAADKAVDVIIDNADKVSGGNEQVKEILENLSDEDKETVSEIIENHMDQETITEVMGYVKEGDQESLIKYAAENLTLEEMEELMEIYDKNSWPGQN